MTGAAKGSPLRQRMMDQMRIANLAESTRRAYIFEVERLARHYETSPDDLDGEQVRDFVLTLIDRGLSPATTNSTLSALRFLYVDTLGCPDRVAGVRNRKLPARLPRHMTEQEVERLILATPDLRHRAAFVTAYGAGLRVSETVAVKVGDIKSDKKLLHVPRGKGGSERMAPLPDGVIDYLRGYFKKHLAAAGNLAILRCVARSAHLDGDPAPCFQERPRAGRYRPLSQLPLAASLDRDPSS